jgi:hypothetical protein
LKYYHGNPDGPATTKAIRASGDLRGQTAVGSSPLLTGMKGLKKRGGKQQSTLRMGMTTYSSGNGFYGQVPESPSMSSPSAGGGNRPSKKRLTIEKMRSAVNIEKKKGMSPTSGGKTMKLFA